MTLWLLLLAVMVVAEAGALQAPESASLPAMVATHNAVLDLQGNFVMYWTPRDNDVIFEVQVRTKGYVGLGFSPSGGMRDADIVMAWVKDGEVFLHDRFSGGYSMPVIDQSQDVELMGGYENDTHTVIRFSRPWRTCDDDQDMELNEETIRVIWAYSYEDPTDDTTMTRHNKRGTKSLYLQDPQYALPEMTPDVKTWDVRVGNVTVPETVDTIYWCKLFKVPDLPRKSHVIGFHPLIDPGHEELVHHFILFECHLPNASRHYEKWLDQDGSQCHADNMPISWRFCSKILVVWAIGGYGETLPEHVGFPLGEEYGGATYFMIEMHYDNPNLKPDIIDNSGIRIFYTEKLRQHDAGVMLIGHSISPTQIIPPNQNWTSHGYCPGSCTERQFPETGINFFQGFLHSHLLGRAISLRHIRGDKEMPNVLNDDSYDFNFQHTRVLKNEVNVLPGDSLITECTYDSSSRRIPTFGGLGTSEEMCMSFMSYYPRIDLVNCFSEMPLDGILDSIGVELDYKIDIWKITLQGYKMDEDYEQQVYENVVSNGAAPANELKMQWLYHLMFANAPEKWNGMVLYDVLHEEETWKDPKVNEALQYASTKAPQLSHCLTKDWRREDVDVRTTLAAYPVFTPLQPEVKQCRPYHKEKHTPAITNRTTTVETTTKSGLRGPGPTLITRTKITNGTRTISRGTMKFGSRRKPSTTGTTFASGARPFTGTRSSAGNRFRGSSKFNRRRIEAGTRANVGTTSGPRATSTTETISNTIPNGGTTSRPRTTSRTDSASNTITTDEGTSSSPRITSRTGPISNTITTNDGTTTSPRTTTRTRTTTEAVPLPDELPKTRFSHADRPDHSARYNVKQIFEGTLQYVKGIQLVSSDPKVEAIAVVKTAKPKTGTHTNDETTADAGTTTTTKSHPRTTSHPSTTTTHPGTTTNARTSTTREKFNGETTRANVAARPNGSTRLNGRTRVNGGMRLNSGTEVNGGTAGATRVNGRTTRMRVNSGTTRAQPNGEASMNSGRRLTGRRVNGGTARNGGNRLNGGVRPTVGARTPTRTVIRTTPLSRTTPETTSNPDTTAEPTSSTMMPGRWLTVRPRNGAATRGHSRRPPTIARVGSGVQPNPLLTRTRSRSTTPSTLPETSFPSTTPSPTPGHKKLQTPSAKLSP